MRPVVVPWMLAFLLTLWFVPSTSWAQSLQIAPISVELLPGQMTATLIVTNVGALPSTVQARPFHWMQLDGMDHLDDTEDLAVSPPITEIAAGQAQYFRVLLRRPATAEEGTYRLLLDQLPPPITEPGVLVTLRLSVPVFADAPVRAGPLEWRVILDNGGASLVVKNMGKKHIRVYSPVLTQHGGKLSVLAGNSPYVLAGDQRRWRIQTGGSLRAGMALHLTAQSDTGPIAVVINATAG